MSSHIPLHTPTCTGSIQPTFTNHVPLQGHVGHTGTGAGQDMEHDLQGFMAYPGVRDTHSNKPGSRAGCEECHRPTVRTQRKGLLTGDGSVPRSWQELALVGGEEQKERGPRGLRIWGVNAFLRGRRTLSGVEGKMRPPLRLVFVLPILSLSGVL